MIPEKLFSNKIIWGSQDRCYLDASYSQLQLSRKKPTSFLMSRLENLFETQGRQLQAVLQKKSVKEMTHFVTNMNYFFEKVDVTQPSMRNDRQVDSHIGYLFTYFFINLVVIGFIFSPDKSHNEGVKKAVLYGSLAITASVAAILVFKLLKWKCGDFIRNIKLRFGNGSPWKRIQFRFNNLVSSLQPSLLKVQQTSRDYAVVDRLWKESEGNLLTPLESIRSRLAYRRFLNLYRKKSQTHLVVMHANSLCNRMVVDFFTALVSKKEPQRYTKSFKWLRFNTRDHVNEVENVRSYFKKYPRIHDGDRLFQEDLVSVSLNPWDTTALESALYFWLTGQNIDEDFTATTINVLKQTYLFDESVGRKIRNSLLQIRNQFFPSPTRRTPLIDKAIKKIAHYLGDPSAAYLGVMNRNRVGNFYAICLPKTLVENPGFNCIYESAEFGRPKERDYPESLFDKFQSLWPYRNENAQGRLLKSGLFPEKGVEIYEFNTLENNQQYKEEIVKLVHEVAPLLHPKPSVLGGPRDIYK